MNPSSLASILVRNAARVNVRLVNPESSATQLLNARFRERLELVGDRLISVVVAEVPWVWAVFWSSGTVISCHAVLLRLDK